MKRIIRTADSLLDQALLLICMMLILLGVYSFADNAYLFSAASDRSILYYRPALTEPIPEEKLITENQVAWIHIDGTGVDFPVLQGPDNVEYLNKDPYGEFSFSGSIFLDSRNASDFSDGYSVIYGHHMSGGHMFGCLDEFMDESYLKEHRYGTLSTKDTVYDIELFAVVRCRATDPFIFDPEMKSAELVSEYIQGSALILLDAEEGSKVIALTTCTQSGDDDRLAVCGYLKERTEIK